MALAGAGGGGFLYALTKEPNSKDKIQTLLDSLNMNMKTFKLLKLFTNGLLSSI